MNPNVSRTFRVPPGVDQAPVPRRTFNLTNAPSLNADGSVRSYNGYSVITGTYSTARQLQVGAKLTF
jgi:hypothetical protein